MESQENAFCSNKFISPPIYIFFNFIYSFFFFFFWAILGLCCCVGCLIFSALFSLVAASRSYPAAVVHRFLIAVASLVAEHGLHGVQASVAAAWGLRSCGSWSLEYRLHSWGTQVSLLCSMWDLSGSGIKTLDSLPLSHQGSPSSYIFNWWAM